MRTHRLWFLLILSILAVVAALPADAQPGYCGEICSYWPPRAACSQACLNCPGTCIEYPDVGCPDCAYWTTCGEVGYLCLSSGLDEPSPPVTPILPGLNAPADPASLPVLSIGSWLCAGKRGS